MRIRVTLQAWDVFRGLDRSQERFRIQTADGTWWARVMFTQLEEDGANVVVTCEMLEEIIEE